MSRSPCHALLALAFVAAPAAAQQQPASMAMNDAQKMVEVHADHLEWAPLEIPGFATGLQLAVLQGDPSQPGIYTVRLQFPAGYVFPAHWHPNAENLTVVSGTFLLGMGDKTDAAALKTYQAGDFLYLPGKSPHFGRVEGAAVIQLHGEGPFATTVVEKTAASSSR